MAAVGDLVFVARINGGGEPLLFDAAQSVPYKVAFAPTSGGVIDATPAAGEWSLRVGAEGGSHLVLDNQYISAKANATSWRELWLNPFGGDVRLGTTGANFTVFVYGRLNLVARSSTPGSPVAGDLWYDNVLGKYRCFEGGAAVDLRSGGPLAWSDQASNFTAVAGGRYRITANNVTCTLPTSPADGSEVAFLAATSSITGFAVARGGTNTIMGGTANLTQDGLPNFSFSLTYRTTGTDWRLF